MEPVLASTKLEIQSDNQQATASSSNAVNSFTTQRDIGRFVAYVLTNLPRSKLERRIFRIEAERKSFNQFSKEYEEKTGKKLSVRYQSESELKAAISRNPADRMSALQLDWGLGGGLIGAMDRLSVLDHPEWNPKTIADVQEVESRYFHDMDSRRRKARSKSRSPSHRSLGH